MQSIISICNEALYHVGITRRIASLDEVSQEGKICKQFYEPSRDELLLEHPWNFAGMSNKLPELIDRSLFGLHVYGYPENCLHVRRVFCPIRPDLDIWYKVQRGENGGKVIAVRDFPHDNFRIPVGHVWAEYTAKVTDPLEYPAPFAEALALKLSIKITLALKGDSTGLRDNLMQYYGDAFRRAVELDASEGSHYEHLPQWSEYIWCRR